MSLSLPTVDSANRLTTDEGLAHVFLAGAGSVGQAFLQQVGKVALTGPPIRVIGTCTSRYAVWNTGSEAVPAPESEIAYPMAWADLLPRLIEKAPRPLIFVDATGSPEVARLYERLLEAGIHVVTPSKLANTQAQANFDRLSAYARNGGPQYRYETTVGAGLPVIQVLQDLLATGDRIRAIRGVVSGTLAFLFNRLRDGTSFSAAVRQAKARGYTEPDVRDDLSGEDVARKFLILARTAGFRLERRHVRVESLVPEELRVRSLETFLQRLPALDNDWHDRVQHAQAGGSVLQYVGHFDGEHIRVGVESIPGDDPLARLQGTDNLIAFNTERYAETPLVVQGPGAGPDVTAAGVLADVLKVAAATLPL